MSGKPSKNTADKAENKTAEKIDSGATQEAGAEEIAGQPAAVSGSPKPLSAAGVASRLHVIIDAGADRGRWAVERVVESRLGSWWTSTERPSFVDWALLGVTL